MRKNSTTTPQTPAQPNAPVMSQVSPVKAMPAPVPSGATTSPPMNQAKMADEQPEESRIPRGAIGGTMGGLAALAATLPRVIAERRLLAPNVEPEYHEMYASQRGDYHKALGRAVGATLLSSALGVGMERLARGMAPTAKTVHDGQQLSRRETGAPDPKLAFNRSTVFRRQLGPHTFHVEYPEDMSVSGVQSKYDYGYLPGRKGPDGDSLDFYIGHDPQGSIARFTKKLPGVEGDADHKYFAGFTPEQLKDYQARFPEYTHQPGAALTDRVDFNNWEELNKHLESLPKTGPLTRLQETLGRRAPMKVTEPEKTADAREVLQKFFDVKDAYIAGPLMEHAANFAANFTEGLASPIHTVRSLPADMRAEGIPLPLRAVNAAGALAGLGTLGYGAYRGGKALVHKMTADDNND